MGKNVITICDDIFIITNCDDGFAKKQNREILTLCFYRTLSNNASKCFKKSKSQKNEYLPAGRQVAIVRAFVALRRTLLNIENLQIQIKDLESKYDRQFEDIFEAIQFLMTENKEIATQSE
jgi:hypothetical protein